jgi:hypothetical protein
LAVLFIVITLSRSSNSSIIFVSYDHPFAVDCRIAG